jgi:membrane protein YqaA with SNARE-associated domain
MLEAFGRWILQIATALGGPGLLLIAMADSSFLSIPEGNDFLIVALSIGKSWEDMFYLATMTIIGSVIGCLVLFIVGRKGGERLLLKRFDPGKVERAERYVQKYGIFSVMIPSILPPPMPFKIFVLTAGVFQLSTSRFLVAVIIGRSMRYFTWGILSVLYGEQVRQFMMDHLQSVGLSLLAVCILAALGFYLLTRKHGARGAVIAMVLLTLLLHNTACIKSTKVIKTPIQILQAKTLSREQAIELLEKRAAALKAIQVSSLKAHFVGGDLESGKVDRYLGVPGYLLGQRPGSLRITLQNPVTKSSLADLVTNGLEFKLWIPRLNKLITGPANLEKIDDPRVGNNPLASIRPQHLIPALFFGALPESARNRLFLEEDTDSLAKFYIIAVVEPDSAGNIRLSRRIWLERSSLQVTRERYYAADGVVQSEIRYPQYRDFEGTQLPSRIELQRMAEHYTLALELLRVKLNPDLQPAAFQLAQIPGAELVELGKAKP